MPVHGSLQIGQFRYFCVSFQLDTASVAVINTINTDSVHLSAVYTVNTDLKGQRMYVV